MIHKLSPSLQVPTFSWEKSGTEKHPLSAGKVLFLN